MPDTQTEKNQPAGKTAFAFAWQIFIALAFLAVMFFAGMFGTIIIIFSSLHQTWDFTFLLILLAALSVAFFASRFKNFKKVRNYALGTAILALALLAARPLYHYLTVERYPQMSDRLNWHRYDPFTKDSKIVRVQAEPQFLITDELPSIDGAYALYPVYSGVVQSLYPAGKFQKKSRKLLNTNGSHIIFRRLLDGEADLIFSAPPSKAQLADAEKRNMRYEITPFAQEAFVFFVHRKNPVDNLTSEQVRQIYSGQITDWSQIDARFHGKIRAFQRNEGSGSQTMLQKIMGNTPVSKPPLENRRDMMTGIISVVADYRNYKEALGFSFRFFSMEMFRNNEIKLLAVDGIAPTRENIRNGTYPFIADCCVITVKKRTPGIRKIVDFLFSPAGVRLIEETGYTPLIRQEKQK